MKFNGNRNEVIEKWLPHVHRCVRQSNHCVSKEYYDDLLGYAYEGLIEAVDSHDDKKGASLKTRIEFIVHKRVQDGMREMDCLSRVNRARIKTGKGAKIGKLSGINAIEHIAVVSQEDGEENPLEIPDNAPPPYHRLDVEQTITRLHELLDEQCSEHHRAKAVLAFRLYYDNENGMSYREIKDILGVNESRVSQMVCQIRDVVFAKLRQEIA